MAGTEVVKFDANAYVDKLREKIKQSMMDVIPDEQWDALARAEIAKFFEPQKVSTYYNSETRPSEFATIVQGVLKDHVKSHVAKMLERPEWQPTWAADGELSLTEKIGELMKEHGPMILNTWLSQAFKQIVFDLHRSAREG